MKPLLLLLLAAPFLMAADKPADQLGPFRIGMSFVEARAAAPSLAFTEVRSDGNRLGLTAQNAVVVAGDAYDITIHEPLRGAHEVLLSANTKDDIWACAARAKRLVEALDERFGPMAPLAETYDQDLVAEASGKRWRVDNRVVLDAGPPPSARSPYKREIIRRSQVDVARPFARETWLTGRRTSGDNPYDIHLRMEAYALTAEPCQIRTTIRRIPANYAPVEWLDYETRRKSLPLIGVKHHNLDGVLLPADGARVSLLCEVVRASGQLKRCLAPDKPDPQIAAAAIRTARAAAMDIAGIDPDDPAPLLMRAFITLKPSDRVNLYTPPTIDETARPVWQTKPDAAVVNDYYPGRALELERPGILDAQCQIQRDGSLVCPGVQARPVGQGFERAGVNLITQFRAGPTLADGRPSRGVWIQLTIHFVIGE